MYCLLHALSIKKASGLAGIIAEPGFLPDLGKNAGFWL